MRHLPGLRYLTIAAALCLLTAAYTQPEKIAKDIAGSLVPPELRLSATVENGSCGSYGEVTLLSGASAAELSEIYRALQYDLDSIRDGEAEVPPLLLADLPEDISSIDVIEKRKDLFLSAILPAVVFIDERILEERRFVESVGKRLAAGSQPSARDQARLEKLAECYGVSSEDTEALLRRVDIVPPALALAQAAIESGWGTSRFARDGNAILGQHTSTKQGLAPAGLSNPDFRVQSFGHLLDSVAAFARNLNTHPAYAEFRRLRAEMRREGQKIDSTALAGTLLRYSELGPKYVGELRTIIRSNRLAPLDRLMPGNGEILSARN